MVKPDQGKGFYAFGKILKLAGNVKCKANGLLKEARQGPTRQPFVTKKGYIVTPSRSLADTMVSLEQ